MAGDGHGRLEVLDRLSGRGDGAANEDVAGHGERSAWVLDGATGLADRRLLPGPSDAAWLARVLDDGLRRLADDPGLGPRNLVARLLGEAAEAFAAGRLDPGGEPAEAHELPSAGMILVRLRGGRLEHARLGDCRAILAPAGDAPVLATGRSPLHRLDAAALRAMAALRRSDPALAYADLFAALRPRLRANRARMNRPGGYWVLGLDATAARHMRTGVIDLRAASDPLRVLLVSDGLYRLVDTFGAYPDDGALLRRALDRGLASLLAELRALEDADPACEAHPRLKSRDDATALLLEATPD